MGWAVFSRHIGLMRIRQCLVKAPPPWHQERTLRNVGLHRQILVKFACIWKAAQSERPRGWFYITIATFYIIIYNRCCIRIYYLMTWANWLLILCLGSAKAWWWDKRDVQHPRLFRSLKLLLTAEYGVAVGRKKDVITMNSINGLNFYDALTKFIIGFLITFWWLPETIICGSAYCSCGVSLNAVQTFLYGISCFIAGFVWEAVYNLCGCGYGYVCKKIKCIT